MLVIISTKDIYNLGKTLLGIALKCVVKDATEELEAIRLEFDRKIK
jgi:hypothetical protein